MGNPEETAAERSMVATLRERFDEVVDVTMKHLLTESDSPYVGIPADRLRPLIVAGLECVILDFEAAEPHHFGDYLAKVVETRIRQGFKITDMMEPIRITEVSLQKFYVDAVASPIARIAVLERTHKIFTATARALFGAYVRVHEEFLREQLDVINQIASPILPIYTGVLVMPLVGAVERRRAQHIMHTLLKSVVDHRAEVVIIDITGVPSIDESAAACLSDSARAVRLLGAEVVLVGISPAVAQAMLERQLDVSGMQTRSTLQAGLIYALARRGLAIGAPGARLG